MSDEPDDGSDLVEAQDRYQHADADAAEARIAYYRAILKYADGGATQEWLGDRLGVSRRRAGQLIDQARHALR